MGSRSTHGDGGRKVRIGGVWGGGDEQLTIATFDKTSLTLGDQESEPPQNRQWVHGVHTLSVCIELLVQSSGLYCAARLLFHGNYWYPELSFQRRVVQPAALTMPLDC